MSEPWFANQIGTWPELVARLDAGATLQRWQVHEPQLIGSSCEDIRAQSCDPARGDVVLGCLIRLASVHGAADNDAALVIVHLLTPACSALLRRFGPKRAAAAELLFGELVLHIRSSIRFDGRAHAVNLLRRAEAGLRRQLADRFAQGAWRYDCPQPFHIDSEDELLLPPEVPDENDELQLIDLLLWAERTGVVAASDVSLLIEMTREDDPPGRDTQRVAAVLGVSVRTVERRRRAAVTALSEASAAFLAAAA